MTFERQMPCCRVKTPNRKCTNGSPNMFCYYYKSAHLIIESYRPIWINTYIHPHNHTSIIIAITVRCNRFVIVINNCGNNCENCALKTTQAQIA